MRQTISESQALGFFKKPIKAGLYEMFGEIKGGVYNPKLGCFDMKPVSNWSTLLVVVEDDYYCHGNGD